MKPLFSTAIGLALFLTASTAFAGRARQDYVDGCQSQDGRFVVTTELVGANPKDPKAGRWKFHWKDTKSNETQTGDLLGLPPVGAFAHIFVAPGGETFAVWNPFAYCPTKSAPDGKLGNGGKFVNGEDKNWPDHPALAHRLVVYRKTGEVVKTLTIKDFLEPAELPEVFMVFHTVRWVTEYPGLSFGGAPRVGYGTYRVSPDYTVLEFTAPKLGKNKSGRTVRANLMTGALLEPAAKLDPVKTPIRPFQGPDRVTQDEQYLWQPSLDPARIAGSLKASAK